MRVLLCVAGVFFVGLAAAALSGDIRVGVAITVVSVVALGAYFISGRQRGKEPRGGAGVLLGRVLAYLVGAALLVSGAIYLVLGAQGLLGLTFVPGWRSQFSGLLAIVGPPSGALSAGAGIAVLIAAGRIGVQRTDSQSE